MSTVLEIIAKAVPALIDLIRQAVSGDIAAAQRVSEILPPGEPLKSELVKLAADAAAEKKFGPRK